MHGTERYATWADFEEGELVSACSCPYGATCKHAVAVVLEYLDHLNKNIEIHQLTEQDRRLELTAEAWEREHGAKRMRKGLRMPVSSLPTKGWGQVLLLALFRDKRIPWQGPSEWNTKEVCTM